MLTVESIVRGICQNVNAGRLVPGTLRRSQSAGSIAAATAWSWKFTAFSWVAIMRFACTALVCQPRFPLAQLFHEPRRDRHGDARTRGVLEDGSPDGVELERQTSRLVALHR